MFNIFCSRYVRVPHADGSLHAIPDNASETQLEGFVMMSDILPTGLEVGVMDGANRVGLVGVGADRRVAIIPSRITFVNPVK